METLAHLFSHVCGQERCFIVDHVALPVCQRCLGLYLGVLFTVVWMFATGLWRRGEPGATTVVLHVTLLFVAMLGGIHVIDPGPLWRLGFGLWTGHVVTCWLLWATVLLKSQSGMPPAHARKPKHQFDLAVFAFPVLLAGFAAGFPELIGIGWWTWSLATALGFTLLAIAILLAVGTALWSLTLSGRDASAS